MVDATVAIIASVLAGVAGGFLSSWMAFNASGEKFDGKKHGNAIITGALTGMALGLGLVVAHDVVSKEEIPGPVVAVGLFSVFLAAAGIDRLRSSGTRMIANKSKPTETAPAPTSPETKS